MNKLAEIINNVGAQELVLIQKDLEAGTLSKLVTQRLQDFQKGKLKTCPTCGARIAENESYKLEFGDVQLRRQAHFDALDCLEHFVANRLKKKEDAE